MELSILLIFVAAFFGIFASLFYLLTLYENKDKLANPKPNRLYSVSVIVPAFNEEGRIGRTVESLLNLKYPKDLLEIILVDDGSTDGTWKEMVGFASNRIKIFQKKNGGKASALNFGIKNASGEIIVSLDADSFVDPNALINMVGHFNDEACMSVTPTMKIWKPKTILQRIQFVEFMFGIFLRKISAFLGCINVTPGPFSAYRKSFFEKYGGYEEGNLTEDIEIALRIQSNNFKIENSRDAFSYTIGPSKFMPLFRQRVRWYLGFINNVLKYRHMFSRKYGTLGVFFLPSAIISVLLTIMLISYALKKFLFNAYDSLFSLWSINFDVIKLFSFKFDNFYPLPNMVTTIALVSILFTAIIIYLARKISYDKEKIFVSFLFSLLFYAPLFALWWFISFIYKINGKKLNWSGISWEKD